MKRLGIIGSGDLAQQIAYHAKVDNHYNPVCYFDDFIEKDSLRNGLPIKGGINDVLDCYKEGFFDVLMIGIGYNHMRIRKNIFEKFASDIPLGKIIHHSCYVDPSATIGDGSFLFPGCILDLNVTLGENVILYTGCCISHDSMVGNHSIFSPSINIAGFVKIGECVNLGIGTTIIDNLSICADTKTGAGTVIIRNIDKPGTYIGCPSRLLIKE